MDGQSGRFQVEGSFDRAARQFEADLRRRAEEQAPRRRLDRAITMIDSMLGTIESLNLNGAKAPPGVLESGITTLVEVIPYQCGISLTASRSPQKLMDQLFNVQERLMAMRAGPAWEWAFADEEPELVEPARLQLSG